MDKNSERFINSFNRIDMELKQLMGINHYVRFSDKVEQLSERNAVIRRFKTDLLEFSELRNAIVHQRTNPNFVIAEPHDSIVEKIESIESQIIEPEKVIPKFYGSVQTFQLTDFLSDLLKLVDEKKYSQFPIYEGNRFKGLLTTNGITNWLAQNINEEIISITEATIEEMMYKILCKQISR